MSSPIQNSRLWNMTEVYKDMGHLKPIKPKISHDEKMVKVWYEGNSDDKNLDWDDTNLSISINYGGGEKHPVDAYILDTSSKDQQSYTLYLDVNNKDDISEGIVGDVIQVELSGFTLRGTKFMVLNGGNKVGEATFQ